MVSQTSEYALRAVACLARRPGEPMTTRQIAVASRVPAGYLARILQSLARAGIVSGQRGLRGGFVLTRRPDQLTLLDVVYVADGSRRITACPLGIPQHAPGLCPLHRRLDDAAALAEQTLADVTVADVLYEPLCGARTTTDGACAADGAEVTSGRAAELAGPCRSDSMRSAEPLRMSDRSNRGRDRTGTSSLAPLCDHRETCPGATGVCAKSA